MATRTVAGAVTAGMAGSLRSASGPSNGTAATDRASLPYLFIIFQRQTKPWANNSPHTIAVRTESGSLRFRLSRDSSYVFTHENTKDSASLW